MCKGIVEEYNEIADVINLLIESYRTGNSDSLKSAFHENATVNGQPIQTLFEQIEILGSDKEIRARIDIFDVQGTVASARVELENYHNASYTDYHHLIKVLGEWKIVSNVCHERTKNHESENRESYVFTAAS